LEAAAQTLAPAMTLKPCSRCRVFKSLTEFDHSRASRDNRHHRCKACDRRRDKQRLRDGTMQASISRWGERYPERIAAHKAVQQAVKAGTLERSPCASCGSTKAVHAHHEDYTRPLDVTWLCHPCHIEHHRLERLYGKGQELFSFMGEGRP
jgi:hypothetical protein